jgi:hypothetical protein
MNIFLLYRKCKREKVANAVKIIANKFVSMEKDLEI